ncbi:hypothetical protein BIZ37_30125, partial [Photobacterium sp. BZF1]|uniref:hypothetical protein n=1 Tax=Photobacterium sp. BZF1 TaxID=1904457 RepID=UPI00165341CC
MFGFVKKQKLHVAEEIIEKLTEELEQKRQLIKSVKFHLASEVLQLQENKEKLIRESVSIQHKIDERLNDAKASADEMFSTAVHDSKKEAERIEKKAADTLSMAEKEAAKRNEKAKLECEILTSET